MGKTIKRLNQELSLELADLDINGINIESYYDKRFQVFLFDNSELTPKERIEAILSGQINGKTEVIIQKVLSERTFIQDQIIKTEADLMQPIRPVNREKLLIWLDYLRQREKAINPIKLKVPSWSQPLIALYMVYKGIQCNDDNVEKVCKSLKYDKGRTEIKGAFHTYKQIENRTFLNMETKSEKGKADAQLTRLTDLKLIMEDRGEKGAGSYEDLLSDIKKLRRNLGYL